MEFLIRTMQGDTFDLIAQREYGTTEYAEALMNANREHIETQIFDVGVELREATLEKKATEVLPPWRR